MHGRGLGTDLLFNALERAASAIEIGGGRLIVVDAIDQHAVRFYQHHRFRQSPAQPARLFQKASDIAAALRQG